MNIVILKERMSGEGRVALTPDHCLQLAILGHAVYVERGAGKKSGYSDAAYRFHEVCVVSLGKIIPLLESPDTVVLKVKQPLPEDTVWLSRMKNGTLFAYFHSTGEKDRCTIDALLAQNITAVSYENIRAKNGTYPILIPMSKIAGRLAATWGVALKETRRATGLPSLINKHLRVSIFGLGTVGLAAVKEARRLGCFVTVFEKDESKWLTLINNLTPTEMTQVKIFLPDDSWYEYEKARALRQSDIVIGAVLIPGGHAPTVVSEEEVKSMQKGSAIVDVACDQGGCIWYPEEMSGCPIFEWEGKLFCRTPNMPGSVPRESTPALTSVIFPYLLDVLDNGAEAGFRKNIDLRKGILTHCGKIMNKKAAAYWDENYTDPDAVFVS